MRSVKRELERKRSALRREIQSRVGSTRQTDRHGELAKDPYGSAPLTHDDEIAAAVVDRRVMPFATRCVTCQARRESARRAA